MSAEVTVAKDSPIPALRAMGELLIGEREDGRSKFILPAIGQNHTAPQITDIRHMLIATSGSSLEAGDELEMTLSGRESIDVGMKSIECDVFEYSFSNSWEDKNSTRKSVFKGRTWISREAGVLRSDGTSVNEYRKDDEMTLITVSSEKRIAAFQ